MSILHEKTEQALALIAEGDEAGIDLLYACMGKRMLLVARGIVGDAFLAEDVVQESFLKIVKNITKYRRGTNGCAWICRIVRNTALNSVKGRKARCESDLDELQSLPDGEDLAERSETRLLAEHVLRSLSPPIVRNMVYMKYFLDMTVREIARAVGKSKSYVAKEIARAEERMRAMLKEPWTK